MSRTPLTDQLIESLDLVYYACSLRETDNVNGVILQPVQWKPETRTVNNPMIIGAVLVPNHNIGYSPSPVFSEGRLEPREVEVGGSLVRRWEGLHASGIKDGYLVLSPKWEGSIDVDRLGNAQIYAGQGNWFPAVVFGSPLQFNPAKQLVYVRSPNNSRSFHVLHTEELEENGKKVPYSIVHESLPDIRKEKWARNYRGCLGFEQNSHLNPNI